MQNGTQAVREHGEEVGEGGESPVRNEEGRYGDDHPAKLGVSGE